MTAPLINQAHSIAFLAYGNKKADAVKAVINGTHRPMEFPAQLINPASGDLDWYLDSQAASLLS
jgi:6-phosphogluconolactonase